MADSESQPERCKIKVDEWVTLNDAEVYEDWGCTLNLTNIGNNNNKFYVIQLLSQGGCYHCFTRWGRVGERGQSVTWSDLTLVQAQRDFKKRFFHKTGNHWDIVSKDIGAFVLQPNLYSLLKINYDGERDSDFQTELHLSDKTSKKVRPSKLNQETQDLISLIFDLDMFKEQMAKFELNVKELPVKKLSAAQVDRGFAVLEKISAAIDQGAPKSTFGTLCSQFYTLIPHTFGRRVPPILSDAESVQQKKNMLCVLRDIVLVQELTKKGETEDDKSDDEEWMANPIDKNYGLLHADVKPLETSSEEWNVINTYLDNTMASGEYVKLLEIFKVQRDSEPARFAEHEDIAERKLLWHGTNVAALVAILSTGIRITPHGGSRLGKGIYFASEISKSASDVSCTSDNVGFMFLNEVALGKQHEIVKDDLTLSAPPEGFDSIVARGWTEPDPKDNYVLKLDGHDVVVPLGKPIKTEHAHSTFTQSEYLIYKESQNQIRYLLKLQF